ncbi:hypothetical protein IPJ72_03110 [Candidatus Peregrinibacteria bacterium]|nr:MAG: hypothetical protein IPJ72_03110 [Candidatus Peregrinibacteria bacterium]
MHILVENGLAQEKIQSIEEPIRVENAPSNPLELGEFKVIDPTTDRRLNEDGSITDRYYQMPRPLVEQSEGLATQTKDWNLFHQTPETQLKKDERGYQFSIPESSKSEIEFAAGTMQMGSKELMPLKNASFKQGKQDSSDVTEYTELYPNVDVRFDDEGGVRRKTITLNQKPSILKPDESIIFWEKITLPEGAVLQDDQGNKIKTGDELLKKTAHH